MHFGQRPFAVPRAQGPPNRDTRGFANRVVIVAPGLRHLLDCLAHLLRHGLLRFDDLVGILDAEERYLRVDGEKAALVEDDGNSF